MSATRNRRPLFLLMSLVLAAGANGGANCGPFNNIAIDQPPLGSVFDNDPVAIALRIGRGFDPLSVEVELDGVDLIAALGLTPPFSGAGGVVNVGGDLVTVSNFDFTDTPTKFVNLEISDLDTADRTLVVRGVKSGVGLQQKTRPFVFVDFFTQELEIFSAAGLAEPEQTGPGGTILANASLGDPFASPPVTFPDDSVLRQGFVEAAEGRIAAP